MNRETSILILIDFQPGMLKPIERATIPALEYAARQVAKAAAIAGVPTLCSQISGKKNGPFLESIALNFPVIERKKPGFDVTQDAASMRWIESKRAEGRDEIIISGLWTSICFAFSAISLVKKGFKVYGLVDATADVSEDAKKYGIKRMVHNWGIQPVTCLPVASAWMRSWNDPTAGEMSKEVWDTKAPKSIKRC